MGRFYLRTVGSQRSEIGAGAQVPGLFADKNRPFRVRMVTRSLFEWCPHGLLTPVRLRIARSGLNSASVHSLRTADGACPARTGLAEVRPTPMTTGQLNDLACHHIDDELLLTSGVMIASDPQLRPCS